MSTTNTTHDSSSTAWLGSLVGELTGEQIDSLVWQRREMSFPEATTEDLRTTDECLMGDAKRTVEENRVLAWVEQQPRLAAPAWHQGAYPTVQMFTKAGELVRTFERYFDTPADGWSCYLLVEDVLTAHGVQRSPTVVHVDGPNEGATPAQARALAPRRWWKLRTRQRRSERPLRAPYSHERPCPGVPGWGRLPIRTKINAKAERAVAQS